MIDTNKLKGLIVAKGYTQGDVAKKLGIATETFYRKMNKGVFYNTEMEIMIKMLDMKDPASIFFAPDNA